MPIVIYLILLVKIEQKKIAAKAPMRYQKVGTAGLRFCVQR